MTERDVLALVTLAAPALTGVFCGVLPRGWVRAGARTGALLTGGSAALLAGTVLADPAHPQVGRWLVLDAAGGLLLAVIAFVGLVSVLVSPAYLDGMTGRSPGSTKGRWRERSYFAVLHAFWAVLLAVPLVGNLGGAWLLVEATTAASALLVGFSGRPTALEAGWKYLVLTTAGLGIALLGIVVLAAGVPGGGIGALDWQALTHYAGGKDTALVAYLLVLVGLAAKIGWAPVHNWLPDAHSEAPAPVSALLSAALLPTVLLVAWRCEQGLTPAVGVHTARTVLVIFGLTSVAVAVPFLARSLPWKRLLAYSSLEHMGVIALGLAFATPLALAGVVVHIVGHAVAKTLGFCAVTPLLAHDRGTARTPVSGLARSRPGLAAVLALALGSLAGLPPSPLFVSELLIIAGGFQAGRAPVAIAATAALALAFVCMVRSLLETVLGESGPTPPERLNPPDRPRLPGMRGVGVLATGSLTALLALAGVAAWLPGSALVHALGKGLS